jgi:hypothetical protein
VEKEIDIEDKRKPLLFITQSKVGFKRVSSKLQHATGIFMGLGSKN